MENRPNENTPANAPENNASAQSPVDGAKAAFSGVLASPLAIGSILSRSFTVLFSKPLLFFGLAALAVFPPIFLVILSPQAVVLAKVMDIISRILGIALQGAIAYGVFRTLRGESASFGDSFSRGMAHIVPLVLASILTGLGIGLGMILLIVPGVILMCVWAVTIPACAIEKLGTIDSITRSAQLTKGYRLPIFGLMLICGLATVLISVVVIGLLMSVTGSFSVAMIVAAVLFTFVQAFTAVMIAILYFDLRSLKEGVSLESLASVFD